MKKISELSKGEQNLIEKVMAGSVDMQYNLYQLIEKKTKKPVVERKRNNPEAGSKGNWQEFFAKVGDTGVKHGVGVPEGTQPVLAINKKDTDECVVAALINHRNVATNVVWSTSYNYPLVFAKITMDELKAVKENLIKAYPENAEIIGVNTTENGNENNFYYDELAEGNFCNRFVNKDGETVYFGYIVDHNICFYRDPDGSTPMVDIMYFFMPRWGTKKKDKNYNKKINAVNDLINRAFGSSNSTVSSKSKEESNMETEEDIEIEENISKRGRRRRNNNIKVEAAETNEALKQIMANAENAMDINLNLSNSRRKRRSNRD